jgi:hypothetical protein
VSATHSNPGEAKIWSTLDGQILISIQAKDGTWAHLEMTVDEAEALSERLAGEVARARRVVDLSKMDWPE